MTKHTNPVNYSFPASFDKYKYRQCELLFSHLSKQRKTRFWRRTNCKIFFRMVLCDLKRKVVFLQNLSFVKSNNPLQQNWKTNLIFHILTIICLVSYSGKFSAMLLWKLDKIQIELACLTVYGKFSSHFSILLPGVPFRFVWSSKIFEQNPVE